MDKQYATQSIGASLAGYADNQKSCSAVECAESPVNQALSGLGGLISECHFQIDALIGGIAPALRSDCPTKAQDSARPAMASELAERIQQMSDSVRNALSKLSDARERLTL